MDDKTPQQGTKRKRYEPPKEDVGVKLGGKLHHNLKEVKKAAKKAKNFEIQKLVKKLKGLRVKDKNSPDTKDAEAQLEALKGTDHETVATTALKTKIHKDRILSKNEHVQVAVSKELANISTPAAPGTPAAKVQGRLLSSKLLAVEIANVISDLRGVLQPKHDATAEGEEGLVEGPPKKVKKSKAKSEDSLSVKRTLISEPDEDKSEREDLDAEDQEDNAGWESGTVDGGDEERDGAWESDSVDRPVFGNDISDFLSEDSTDNKDLDPKPPMKKDPAVKSPKTAVSKANAKAAVKTSGVQSTFLPSLSVGFARGGSDDSDWSDGEAGGADIAPRKNRRGQQARRAIWEKKFGRNANHKKKEGEAREISGSRKGSDANMAPRSYGDKVTYKGGRAPPARQNSSKVPQHRQGVDSGWGQRPVATQVVQPAGPPRASASLMEHKWGRPLHPSWEAKKKLKEKQSAGIVPSQGTKIKF